ncbi:hypothetical protein AVEN_217591-1, partial [Araneus ventricosus]
MTAAAIASSTDAEVLVAHHRSTARPLPQEVRSIIGGETYSPTILYPQEKRVPAYLSDTTHLCTR